MKPAGTMPLVKLVDRYHDLMIHRREALDAHGANEFSVFGGPPTRVSIPVLARSGSQKKRFGPFGFADRAPIAAFIERAIRSFGRPVSILEIGPGRGDLARQLLTTFADRIRAYHAVDRDRSVPGPYKSVGSIDEITGPIDIVIASEVIEHMSADEFYNDLLKPAAARLSMGGAFILSTPNPVAPGGIVRDFSHVQHYPWYDLYAICRLAFTEVEVYRTHYVFDPRRLVALLPRIFLCSLLELDWRDGLVCVARSPLLD